MCATLCAAHSKKMALIAEEGGAVLAGTERGEA